MNDKSAFETFWSTDGAFYDPDSWYQKRKSLAQYAFEAGIKIGMARSRNYTANDEVTPRKASRI